MREILLKEVGNWKLEAKLEDSSRYFYQVETVARIESGEQSYVVGRKGSGKTAICEYLFRYRGPKRFTQKLTFKNFPFNELYSLSNDSYTPPNQYITLWKYIIYSTIAKLLIDNENIDPDIRKKLGKIYGSDPVTSLSRSIVHWTNKSLNLSVLGTGISGSVHRSESGNGTPWIERVDILEQILLRYIDDSKYVVVFDELDEDYKLILENEKYERYNALITSLFKAVQDIKSVFGHTEAQVLPVLFLRDDIYDAIKDPDKTKWSDLVVNLEWSSEQIQNLLAFRLSRAVDPKGSILPFDEAWHLMFSRELVACGREKQKRRQSFNYIERSTMMRPRDFVRYLQDCSKLSLDLGHTIVRAKSIIRADKAFSNYMRSELEDELTGLLPEAREVLDIIAHLRKQIFRVDQFASAYEKAVDNGILPKRSVERLLMVLFHFSVIGNQTRQKTNQVFRYLNREARFNSGEPLCVHRGLFKALQIL
jgi:hypothetical protein